MKLAVVLSAGVLAAAGCSSSGSLPAPSSNLGSALDEAVPQSVLNLPLTDAAGKPTTLAALRGKVVVLGSSMTLCQEICPLLAANFVYLARQSAAAGSAAEVQFVQLTIDPARDVPARLAAYRQLFRPAPSNWSTLTGSAASISAIWRYFGASYQKVAEDSPPAVDWLTGKPLTYDIQHSDVVVFLDARQHQRYLIDEAPNTAGAQPPQALKKFLSAEGQQNLTHPERGASWTPADAAGVVNWIAKKRLVP
ncbi:MAG TPA: SCO family protein [Frankiaceae bacterium]|jgi:protein SCO1/2|nr:SCO family protein [Frankiaceae bacterium]